MKGLSEIPLILNNLTEKTTPVAADILLIEDSADSFKKKKITRGNFSLKTYDSDWFAVATATTYTKTHSLGTTKVIAVAYFSTASDGLANCYKADWNFLPDLQRGCGIALLNTTQISIRTGSSAIFEGVDAAGNEIAPTSGYARIIILALE